MFTMYARNRQADQKIDTLVAPRPQISSPICAAGAARQLLPDALEPPLQFLTCNQDFKLADNYFVISEHKSILGGLFDRTVLKFKKVRPHSRHIGRYSRGHIGRDVRRAPVCSRRPPNPPPPPRLA